MHSSTQVATAPKTTGNKTDAAHQDHLLTGGFDVPQNIHDLHNQHASRYTSARPAHKSIVGTTNDTRQGVRYAPKLFFAGGQLPATFLKALQKFVAAFVAAKTVHGFTVTHRN